MLSDNIEIQGKRVKNRVVIQPMEGADCNLDGSPSELTRKKYLNFAKSGAGIIWFEACAVCAEGRTNLRQMFLTEKNLEKFQALLDEMRELSLRTNGFSPLIILQLTHSGRQSIQPMIIYRNAVYEKTRPADDSMIVTDDYLDSLPEMFVRSARLAAAAGFDGVDIKCCHGYLMAELLSAFGRKGKYGGDFEHRSKCFLECFRRVREDVPKNFIVTSRLGLSDMVKKPYGFGTDEEGNLDLTEGKRLIGELQKSDMNLINVTLGNPYYNPHVNRPFRVGSYRAPEKPETGIQRFYDVEKEIKHTFPDLAVIATGISYYRNDLMEQAEKLLKDGVCDLVGFGRVSLAYPDFYRDYLENKFNGNKCCVACSRCTLLMRSKCVSGCATFDNYYKNIFKEAKL